MTAYYNEIDPYAAQWLRNLIDGGHIAPGDVDERSIVDVRADDLRGYTQAHFFAGIGGWSVALRLAGWPDDRPVWTGSCPCQPFSAAGAGKAGDDERHLWPAWFPLIAECRPPVVFGEQVEAAIGWGWLDLVFADLEGKGYACGAAVLPACGVGAPHIRQRLWFVADALRSGARSAAGGGIREEAEIVGIDGNSPRASVDTRIRSSLGFVADADGGDASAEGLQRGGEQRQQPQDGGAGDLADSGSGGWREQPTERPTPSDRPSGHADSRGGIVELGDAERGRREGWREPDTGPQANLTSGASRSFWSDAEWIACTDGKSRPVEPGSFPLGHGIPNRPSKLRAYGNAIVPQAAAEFIRACS